MKTLYDAAVSDGLPRILASQAWARAFAYAFQAETRRIMDLADRSMSYAVIDKCTEEILDVLAVELRVPRYSEGYSLSVKRTLVRNAINYWAHAGTKYQIQELCSAVFGDADVSEWWEYGGEPGNFKISTTDPSVNAGDITEFSATANQIKRLSQNLQEVELLQINQLNAYYGGMPVNFSVEITKIDQS